MKRLIQSNLLALVCLLSTSLAVGNTELMAVDTAFNRMAQTKGIAEAFEHYLDKNALNLNGGYEGVTGTEVVADYQRRRDTLKMKWWPVTSEISASGDLGYTWGRFIEHKTLDDGTIEEIHGKYITVWRKNAKGEWKSLVDMGSLNPPPGAAKE